MQRINKFYLTVMLIFVCEQIVFGSESKSPASFAGVSFNQCHEVVLEVADLSAQKHKIHVQELVQKILAEEPLLDEEKAFCDHAHRIGTLRSSGRILPANITDLTSSILDLANAVRVNKQEKIASDKQQAAQARADRCLNLTFTSISALVGLGGFVLSVYTASNK